MPGTDPFDTALQADREARARQIRSSWSPEPDAAMRQARERSQETTAKLHSEITGADQELDQALIGLSRFGLELDQSLHGAARSRARVESGEWTREEYQRVIGAVADQAQRDLEERHKAAEAELERARQRLVDELLPVPKRSPETAETKADLQLALGSSRAGDPMDALLALWRRCLGTQDYRALGILRSDWGRDLFVSRGGSADAWDGLLAAMIQEAVSGPFRSQPAAKRLEKLRASGSRAVAALSLTAQGSLAKLRESAKR